MGVSEFSTLLTDSFESLNLTQSAAEKLTGINRTVLSKLTSGAVPPSVTNLKALYAKLAPGSSVGLDLVFAHLRDEMKGLGIDLGEVLIRQKLPGKLDDWWQDVPVSRIARLRALEEGARSDDNFNSLLDSLEPLALRLQAAKVDADERNRLKRGEIFAFPDSSDCSERVAEDAPPPLPRGVSQQPTA